MLELIMSISSKLSKKFKELRPEARKKLTKMCWSDKVTCQEIEKAFDLTPNEIEKYMRFELSEKDYKRWMIRRSKKFNQKSKKAASLRFEVD